jgi:rhodanese-related sulfurtransferase
MTKSFSDLMRDLRAAIREVHPLEVDDLVKAGSSVTIVDVGEAEEWEQGHIPGAVHVSRSYLEQDIESLVPDRSRPVILYCSQGVRSLFAAETLKEMGYADVASMAGGFQQWKAMGLPWTTPVVLTDEQRRRYSRHLLIPEVGAEGQVRLLESKVLLVGAGGLGSPSALYLAAAGVGTIGIVDFDVVDVSNLQRQVLHTTDRVGTKKTASAAATIGALNPDVEVVGHDEVLGPDNVERLISGYDVILDGTDTFETRYVLNDAAFASRAS